MCSVAAVATSSNAGSIIREISNLYRLSLLKKPSDYYVHAPPGLTLNNSTFCPHSLFMCFVWI